MDHFPNIAVLSVAMRRARFAGLVVLLLGIMMFLVDLFVRYIVERGQLPHLLQP